MSAFHHVCAICFAVPGVQCNAAPGWAGAAKHVLPPHERIALEPACAICRGSGVKSVHKGHAVSFECCDHCDGNRFEPLQLRLIEPHWSPKLGPEWRELGGCPWCGLPLKNSERGVAHMDPICLASIRELSGLNCDGQVALVERRRIYA